MTVNVNDPTASGMVLTFDDEFDSNDVSDTGVASGAVWADHWWYDSANPSAVSVSNGVLQLATGGEMSTVNSAGQGFAQTYGYFEIDMKIPAGVGTWPAFFLMSQQHVVNGANPAAEIDIIEAQGNQPNGYYTTLHYDTGTAQDTYSPMPPADFTGDVSSSAISSGYHRFGVLWSPGSDQLTYYFDGKEVNTSNVFSTTNYSPMMILIDNALGDMGFGGNSAQSGVNYGPLDIDYVRVYQFSSQDPTAAVAQAVSPASGQTDSTALANADGDGGSGAILGSGSSSAPASTNGAVVTAASGGDIVDSSGNSYTIVGGQIVANGEPMTGTNSVTELAYVNGTVYQEATSQNLWWSLNSATGTWTETSDPLSSVSTAAVDPPADPPASANGTVVSGATGDIVTAAGNSFAINAAGEVTENGTAMTATNGVTELAYVGGTVYQTAHDLWWSYNETTNAWTETTDPLSGSGSTVASDPPNDPPADPPASANGTVVSGDTGDIVTAAGNSFAIDAAGQVTENGTAMTATNGVTELTYVGGTVYQTAHDLWWSYNETTSAWTETTDPLSGSGSTVASDPPNGPPADPPASANGTVVSGDTSDIVTAAGNTFAISAQGEVTENGTAMAATNGVTELTYVGGTVYQTAHDLWWSYNETTNAWTETSDPLSGSGSSTPVDPPAPTVSMSGTVVSGDTSDIVTAAGNTFAISAQGEVTENGTAMAATNGVTELAYVDGTVYQTAHDLWWSYNETTNAWTETTDPLSGSGSSTPVDPPAPTVSPSGAVVSGDTGDILTTAGNSFAIDAAGQVTENGTAMTATNGVTELTYVGGTVYQTAHDLWWSYNETTNAWTETSDPLVTSVSGSSNEPASGSAAVAPQLTVYASTGPENSAIPLDIQAAQASAGLNPADLTVTVGNLDGATLSEGHNVNGVYTLTEAQLANLTVTPANGFTGTLALQVTATDTETGSAASTPAETLDVAVTTPSTASETMLSPSFTDGGHNVYAVSSVQPNVHIASFDPATDVLDLAPLLASVAQPGLTPMVTFEAGPNGSTEVAVDPTGTAANHGTVVVTLDHVLPQNLPATDVWH